MLSSGDLAWWELWQQYPQQYAFLTKRGGEKGEGGAESEKHRLPRSHTERAGAWGPWIEGPGMLSLRAAKPQLVPTGRWEQRRSPVTGAHAALLD